MLRIEDLGRVRLLTLDRPDALNAFTEALYDATAEAFLAAGRDPGVAVVVLTGVGRAFSAGVDVRELAGRQTGETVPGIHGFGGFVDALASCPKPVICAVNGLAVGIGATMLPHADLVLMSSEARIRCPFTDLGLSPEGGSSFTLPARIGRQQATWLLLSSAWSSAQECLEAGLAWRVCPPEQLLDDALEVAQLLAAKPIASLVATKRLLIAGQAAALAEARAREEVAFAGLLGGPANLEGLAALRERRPPDFGQLDG